MYPLPGKPENVYPLPPTSKGRQRFAELPLISAVPAGRVSTLFPPEYAEDSVTVADLKDPQAFGLRVKGNSMAPRIEDGDIVIVSPQHEARSGDICVVRVNGEDTLKKVKFEGVYVHLVPLNPDFEPMTVKKKDVNFVWKVVKLIKEL
jgi:repressor LexA